MNDQPADTPRPASATGTSAGGIQHGAFVQARRRARREALGVLFEADIRGRDAATLLTEHVAAAINPVAEADAEAAADAAAASGAAPRPRARRHRRRPGPVFAPYTSVLVEGVTADRARIDEALQTFARGWTLERMPTVDRAVLRIGAWEILRQDDLQPAVVIAEALRLAREYSTEESPAFVHGLLGRIVDQREALLA